MKEEYIVITDTEYLNNPVEHDIQTARQVAEEFAIDQNKRYVVLKVVGKVRPPGKPLWSQEFEE